MVESCASKVCDSVVHSLLEKRSELAGLVASVQETVKEEQWQELQHLVQQAADAFQEHWPVSEQPTRFLRLECVCYPKISPERAFSLATGLTVAAREPHTSETVNGVILLLSPADH